MCHFFSIFYTNPRNHLAKNTRNSAHLFEIVGISQFKFEDGHSMLRYSRLLAWNCDGLLVSLVIAKICVWNCASIHR